MEREVGGGIRMGNTCKPKAVSFQCMTKSTTIKKNNNLKKKIKKNKASWLIALFIRGKTFSDFIVKALAFATSPKSLHMLLMVNLPHAC